jgi:hypothetical protein
MLAGGWNRIQLEVQDLASEIERLRRAGARFRNQIVTGIGAKQILLKDRAGNHIELFEPLAGERKQPRERRIHGKRGQVHRAFCHKLDRGGRCCP